MGEQRFREKGAALKLNRMTSFWIAEKGTQVEGVYVRSGHNFSADWMTRELEDKVLRWASSHGFTRVRFRPIWEQLEAIQYNKTLLEWNMPFMREPVKMTNALLRVEWNGTGNVVANAALQFGFEVKYLLPRNDAGANHFLERFGLEPYVSGEIFVIGGSARTEAEVSLFMRDVDHFKPRYAVLITPFGADTGHEEWNYSVILDSTKFGDIMSSLWTISIIGRSRMANLEKTNFARYAKTLGGATSSLVFCRKEMEEES